MKSPPFALVGILAADLLVQLGCNSGKENRVAWL